MGRLTTAEFQPLAITCKMAIVLFRFSQPRLRTSEIGRLRYLLKLAPCWLAKWKLRVSVALKNYQYSFSRTIFRCLLFIFMYGPGTGSCEMNVDGFIQFNWNRHRFSELTPLLDLRRRWQNTIKWYARTGYSDNPPTPTWLRYFGNRFNQGPNLFHWLEHKETGEQHKDKTGFPDFTHRNQLSLSCFHGAAVGLPRSRVNHCKNHACPEVCVLTPSLFSCLS